MSFTRYTAPDSTQNTTNAEAASMTAAASKSFRPKSRPAKMTRFLLHWPGRRDMSRYRASERPGTAFTAVPGTVTGEEVLRAI